MNAAAPDRGWAFAGQELRPAAKHNQMKAEAALLYFSLHDPIEDKVKGFFSERVPLPSSKMHRPSGIPHDPRLKLKESYSCLHCSRKAEFALK